MLIFISGLLVPQGNFSNGHTCSRMVSFVYGSVLEMELLQNGEYKHAVDLTISSSLQQNATFSEY